jgi:hypothetical protein
MQVLAEAPHGNTNYLWCTACAWPRWQKQPMKTVRCEFAHLQIASLPHHRCWSSPRHSCRCCCLPGCCRGYLCRQSLAVHFCQGTACRLRPCRRCCRSRLQRRCRHSRCCRVPPAAAGPCCCCRQTCAAALLPAVLLCPRAPTAALHSQLPASHIMQLLI